MPESPRGKGKSAAAAAAYRSDETITNDYDGVTHDYTRKSGIARTEILLPELQNNVSEFYTRLADVRSKSKPIERRLKTLDEHIKQAEIHAKTEQPTNATPSKSPSTVTHFTKPTAQKSHSMRLQAATSKNT